MTYFGSEIVFVIIHQHPSFSLVDRSVRTPGATTRLLKQYTVFNVY